MYSLSIEISDICIADLVVVHVRSIISTGLILAVESCCVYVQFLVIASI